PVRDRALAFGDTGRTGTEHDADARRAEPVDRAHNGRANLIRCRAQQLIVAAIEIRAVFRQRAERRIDRYDDAGRARTARNRRIQARLTAGEHRGTDLGLVQAERAHDAEVIQEETRHTAGTRHTFASTSRRRSGCSTYGFDSSHA